jgi:NhaA family Na+:H+ antiporter
VEKIFRAGIIAGIGFTMSLFIAGLAFADPALIDLSKIGV